MGKVFELECISMVSKHKWSVFKAHIVVVHIDRLR